MSGYVDNRCSQATVSEVEALIRERDEARAKLAALEMRLDGDPVEALEDLAREYVSDTEALTKMLAHLGDVAAALRAARGEP